MEIWERFTSRARRAVLLAHSAAVHSGARSIAPEHLLLGLLAVNEGGALEVLKAVGVDPARLATDLQNLSPAAAKAEASTEVAFAPDAQRVLSLGYNEARQMGGSHVGTEHILLGLLWLGEGPAFRLLRDYGARAKNLRPLVMKVGGKVDSHA